MTGAASPRRSRLLPETHPQAGVLLTWPHPDSDWRDDLDAVESVYLAVAREIAARETLLVVCFDERHRQRVQSRLTDAGIAGPSVRTCIAPTNDTWIRDYGPLGVATQAGCELLDFIFNGWGGKHPAGLDNRVTTTLRESGAFGRTPVRHIPVVLEGGSIDTDGSGTLLTTTQCLLTRGRNPGYDRQRFAALFAELMGIDRILWLDHGELAGDDTDAHIDMLARFCAPDTIACMHCEDPDDPHFAPLGAMQRQLQDFRDQRGQPYHLVPLPLPRAVCDAGGRRLPASYTNFLIINGAVLVPVYDDPADAIALQRLAACFPQREVVAINCLPLIHQNGSLHCITMQLPAGVL
jgi:agmatine/peptidylarginine deiminase